MNRSLFMQLSRNLNDATSTASRSLERLSTGSRIVRVKDDPAGSSFLERIDSQLRGMRQAQLNVSAAGGIVSQADTTLGTMEQIALSLRSLAVQASNSNLSADDRSLISLESDELMEQFRQLSLETEFNGSKLLTGSFGPVTVQNGPNSDNNFQFSIGDARATSLGGLAIYSGAQGSIASGIGASAGTVLSLNNIAIGASTDDGLSTSNASRSALAIANAINAQSSDTRVQAEAIGTVRTLEVSFGGSFTGTLASGDFAINGVDIVGSSITDAGDLVTEINESSSQTGVRASLDSTGNISLVASDGRNIQIQLSNASTNNFYDVVDSSSNVSQGLVSASSGLSTGGDQTVSGAVRLFSSEAISIGGGASASQTIGLSQGTQALVSGTSAANVNLSSVDDAENAVKILDATIDDIATLRADIGAIHSRLDYSAQSLVEGEVVLEETKTEFGGSDFAVELATLTMAQLLQDASVSAMTQANVSLSVASRLLDSIDG